MKGIYLHNEKPFSPVYTPEIRAAIEELVDIYAPLQTREMIQADPTILTEADLILGSWLMPQLDERILAAAPNLKVIFYGAGDVSQFMTPAAWERDILVSSAIVSNSIPVAEFAFSQIVLSLKGVWRYAFHAQRHGEFPPLIETPGAYKTTVGLVSLGEIGRRVAQFLKLLDVHVSAYDPFVSAEDAAQLHVELCSLEELFRRSDAVSLHTPWLPETEGMITGDLVASMKPNAALINTARGALIREDELIAVLQQRPDLYAVLDVTWPEPPPPNSPFYTLPNVVLTPHIAGAIYCGDGRRLGWQMAAELERYVNGKPLQWAVKT